ncbi:MAG: S8 family peptidase [Marinagarivorans sp.]
MELHPHLTFLSPQRRTFIDQVGGRGGSKIIAGSPAGQFDRFKPKFDSLEQKFAEHIALCDTISGLTPEKVLVLEIAGSVSDFVKALKRVPGFEDIQQFFTENFADQEHCHYLDKMNKIKAAPIEMFLTMSSQDGLKRLLSEWNKIKKAGKAERGFKPLQNALQQLHDIRFWDTQDRIKSTGLLRDWEEKTARSVEDPTVEKVSIEIELWFRQSAIKRAFAERHIQKLIALNGGTIKGRYVHEGIGYHAVIGELPIDAVKTVLAQGADHLQIMRCDSVMFFRPLGQCGFTLPEEAVPAKRENASASSNALLNQEDIIVALFDGLPLENHTALAPYLYVDDPDDFSSRYEYASDQSHGTAMASLIIHGDKNTALPPLERPLYVRPILAPGPPNIKNQRNEVIPDDHLPIDLIHRAVKRLFEGEGKIAPVARNVKVINLSVCDPQQLFDRNMSPWAKMLDWLSHQYNVLFIVSAGNHHHDIEIDCINIDFKKLPADEIEKLTVLALNQDRWLRRIMSPGEAINALTVKASHIDNFTGITPAITFDPFITPNMFSPINPITSGKNRSTKPEIMMPGGRATFRINDYQDHASVKLKAINTPKPHGPGQLVAQPGQHAGNINQFLFTYGTSNSAALATRRAAQLYDTISSMREFSPGKALDHASDALILKALLLHGAEWPDAAIQKIETTLKNIENSLTFKKDQGQFFGFGHVNENRIHACAGNQATLIHTGTVKLNESDVYLFPLPFCLSGRNAPRRMVITLTWFSPINPFHADYGQAQLWVTGPSKSSHLGFPGTDYYHHHQKKGSVFHHVAYGNQASVFAEDSNLQLNVNCKARAGAKNLSIPYALVVTLDTQDTKLPVYEQVKNRLEQLQKQRITQSG